MSIPIELQDPNNLSSTTSLEALTAENNAAIIEAFNKAVSREGDGPNFMWADLDLNGYRLLNVNTEDQGEEGLVKRKDLSTIMAGEFRKNPSTGDFEYLSPGDDTWTVFYTAAELQGPPGQDGNGIGDLLSSNNLSDVENVEEARSNLGLSLEEDVLPYNASLIGFDPASKADVNDTRFDAYEVSFLTADTTMLVENKARLYRVSENSPTLTLPPVDKTGKVYSVSVSSLANGATLAGSLFEVAGSGVFQNTVNIEPSGYVTVIRLSDSISVVLGTGIV